MEHCFGFTPPMGGKLTSEGAATTNRLALLLAENAAKLRADKSEEEFAKEAGLPAGGTTHRLLQGQNVQLSTLLAFADACKFQAWHLLVPGFNPKQPPELLTVELRKELYALREFKRLVDEASARHRAQRRDSPGTDSDPMGNSETPSQ